MPQVPLEQAGLPLMSLQILLQTPQVSALPRFDSQPLVACKSQSANPAGQEMVEQLPPLQNPGEQSVRQLPQWVALVPRLVSQPLAAFPSQSARPGAQP